MFRNSIRIRFEGESPERFSNLCKNKSIYIWNFEKTRQGYECCIYAKDFSKIKQLVKKTKIKVNIIERHGLYFLYHKYRKRKVFLVAVCLSVFLLIFMTRFIWKIEIRGNYVITNDILYDYLESIGITYGISQKKISCEEICTSLRKDFSEIIWVSASKEGTSLIITVRENRDKIQKTEIDREPKDLIAMEDGEIVSIITRKGTPLVKEGDMVHKDDVLVSSVISVVNDAGELIREESVKADADVILKKQLEFEEICKNIHLEKEYLKTIKPVLVINFFSYQIEMGMHKKADNNEVLSVQRDIRISENFNLPISFRIEKQREYVWKEYSYTEEEQKIVLKEAYDIFREALIESGADIIGEEVQFYNIKNGKLYKGYVEVLQQVVDLS